MSTVDRWGKLPLGGGNELSAKWTLPIIGLFTFSLVSVACTTAERPDDVNNRQNNALYQEEDGYYGNRFISNGNGAIHNDNLGPRNDPTQGLRGQNEIGFVRMNRANHNQGRDGRGGRTQGSDLYIDRHALANHIGSLVTANPDIRDSLVLVTDDHVFVGVDDVRGKKLDKKTMDRVRRTALSVTPRYYDVHVTDDRDMLRRMTDIGHRLTRTGHRGDYREDISTILREMGDDTPPRPRSQRANNINNGIGDFNDVDTGGRLNTGGNRR